MVAVIDDQRTGARVTYKPDYLSTTERRALRSELLQYASSFEGGEMIVGDRCVSTPRLVVAFGDAAYSYPDMGASLPWPPKLRDARASLERDAGHRFNYALVNWYRDGNDYTGWHADKMEMHVPGTSIAIISLGAQRPLAFREQPGGRAACEVPLADGSLLWMHGSTQEQYEHAIPADPDLGEPRLSVTFRFVLESSSTP